MKVPVNVPTLGEREMEYVADCIRTGWISAYGKYVSGFEEGFSQYIGVGHGAATSSGTTALHLAAEALGIGQGDEVIIPAFTIISNALSVIYSGARPVLVDAEPGTWNMDVDLIQERITKKTKAIMPVHIYGHPVDMDPVMEIAEDHGLFVIEDAAEAHGAQYKGRKVGGIGHVGVFSFFANKIITTGEGGMLVTDDQDIYLRAKTLGDMAHSKEKRFLHYELGYNYRMTNLQAAVGLAQLERIGEIIETKIKNAAMYTELLKDVEGLGFPKEMPWAKNVYWMYSLTVEDEFGMTRDDLMKRLEDEGVGTRTFFVPMHRQPALMDRGLFEGESYPVADNISNRGLYLPSGQALTQKQIYYVCSTLKEISGEGS